MPKRARSLSPSDALSSIRLKPGESSGPRVPAHGIILRSDLAAARRLETKTEDDPHGGLIPCSVIMNGTSTVHWVDRYDVRFLLSSIPTNNGSGRTPPLSMIGWEGLPEDCDQTFYLSVKEAEDFRLDRFRREMEANREARIRATEIADAGRHPEQCSDSPESDSDKLDSDEEPDTQQVTLMQRTAAHIMRASNPTQLEMRILANHGADPKFAFLRGRWKQAWERYKAAAAATKATPTWEMTRGLSGLGNYGQSDEDSDS